MTRISIRTEDGSHLQGNVSVIDNLSEIKMLLLDETPDWWRAHNKVKHQRGEHFALANLKNVLNAVAGLFLFVLYYQCDTIDGRRIEPPPTLFTPPVGLAKVSGTWEGGIALFFNREDR